MSRIATLVAVAATLVAASAAGAQSNTPDETPEQVPAHTLDTVIVTATAKKPGLFARIALREEIRAMERDNRRLEVLLARYDRHIEKLEARLDHLRNGVTDSLRAEIRDLDAEAAEVRERRIQLEQRVAEMEARESASSRAARASGAGASTPR